MFDVEPSMFDVHFLYVFLHPLKTAAVDGAVPEFSDGILVGPGGVAFVFGKIELRIVVVEILHQAIPGNFGDN